MTPTDMYDGYAAGILVANPQKRREKVAAMQIEECEKEIERLKARILELETALDNEEERLSTPASTDPMDADDTTDYTDSIPGDDAVLAETEHGPFQDDGSALGPTPPLTGTPDDVPFVQGPDEGNTEVVTDEHSD